MITSCGKMGLDWQTISLGEFSEAVEAWNEDTDGEKPTREANAEKLAAVMKARAG